jgi:hypothetical protein
VLVFLDRMRASLLRSRILRLRTQAKVEESTDDGFDAQNVQNLLAMQNRREGAKAHGYLLERNAVLGLLYSRFTVPALPQAHGFE